MVPLKGLSDNERIRNKVLKYNKLLKLENFPNYCLEEGYKSISVNRALSSSHGGLIKIRLQSL